MKRLNKKGFSLVELLTTIVILGLLMSIAVGGVLIYINRSKDDAFETLEYTSYDGTVDYMMEHNVLLNEGETMSVTLAELYAGDYIERPTDPNDNGRLCDGTVTVTNKSNSSTIGLDKYEYVVKLECGNRDPVTFP